MTSLYLTVRFQVSVSTWLLYRTFDSRPVVAWQSFVRGRLVVGTSCGPPTAFTVWAPVYRGCPCRDPLVCHRVQGDSVAKRQPLLFVCVVGGATENTYTPARLEALSKLSVVAILSPPYHFLQIFNGLWVLSPTRHLVRHVLHLVRDLVDIFSLVVCSVAIRLVHVNANLFVPL